jgi:HAE1 family hydrophobic/amphiphilic exporter-1
MDNVSIVQLTFQDGKDVDIANQEVKDKVDAIINNLPSATQKPVVSKMDVGAEAVISMVLSGKQDAREIYEFADKSLKETLAQISGVAQVEITGGQEREIQVVLDGRTVFTNNVSLNQIGQLISAQNFGLPGGSFKSSNLDVSVSSAGEFNDLSELRNLEIPTPFGAKRLSELAQVNDASLEVSKRTTFFDVQHKVKHENVVGINLVKSSDGNAVAISKSLHKQMKGIKESLPDGMELTIIKDSSDFVQSSVSDTISNVLLGVLFTSIVLLFFLGDIRSTLIVALSMPISIVSTFMLMDYAGFSLNLLSLMGLSVSVGILVTNSIIVLENIFRHKAMGVNSKDAADNGTAEITVAVLAATLTNLVVFIPIATMKGIVGQILWEFSMTIVFATLFSLLQAFTITPMLSSVILPDEEKPSKFKEGIEKVTEKAQNIYRKVLLFLMERKRNSVVVLTATVFLLFFSFFLATKVGFEFMPNMDQGDIKMRVELPIGYNLEETAQALDTIERTLANIPEVLYIRTDLGQISSINTGTNLAVATIKLVNIDDRKLSTPQVVDRMIREVAHIPNAKIFIEAISSLGGAEGSGSPINLNIIGNDNATLNKLSEDIVDKIRDIPGLINLDTSTRSGKPEIIITPNRDQLARTGNTFMEVAVAVRSAVAGMVYTEYKEMGNEYDIRVMMDIESYNSPEKLQNLTIMTSRGKFQLSQLADVSFSEGVNRIIRSDKARTVTISGSPASGVPMGDITGEIDRRVAEMGLPDGYTAKWSGMAEMMTLAATEMLKAALLAILLVYLLLSAILESFKQPFLILSTIPLAFIGVFFILYMTGITMNFISMMSIIMLAGIVVTNAILVLDHSNKLTREGYSVRDALLEACPLKLKPVILTNIAIILGMLPMALGIGSAGREMRQSMGVVSIGGLVMSMVLTLVVLPALYYVMTKVETNKN